MVSINRKLSQMFVLWASCTILITSVLNFIINFLLQVLCNLLFLFLFWLTHVGTPSQIALFLIRVRQIFPHIKEGNFWTCLNLLDSVIPRAHIHTPFDEVFPRSFCLLFCPLCSFLGLLCFCLALLFSHGLLACRTVYCRFSRFSVFLCFLS